MCYTFFYGSLFMQFIGHVLSAFILSTVCHNNYLWIGNLNTLPLCRIRAFIVLLLIFESLPRIYGFIFGKVQFIKKDYSKTFPEGNWVMIGNPFPEYSIEIKGPYPSRSNTQIVNGFEYTQCCTMGGILMTALHALSVKFMKIDIYTGYLKNSNHFLPVIKDPNPGFQSTILMKPTKDERIWIRTYKSTPDEVLYYWVHETHPCIPYDDFFKVSLTNSNIWSFLASTVSIALTLLLLVWTWGGLILVIFIESYIKYLQIYFFKKCMPVGFL